MLWLKFMKWLSNNIFRLRQLIVETFHAIPGPSQCLNMKFQLWTGIFFILSLLYPFIIYFMDSQFPTSYVATGLAAILLLRSIIQHRHQGTSHVFMSLIVAVIMLCLTFHDGRIAVYAYPIMMSLSFAFLLGWSLLYPPSLIERFARILEPDLNADGVAYTRKVTIVWLGFSLLNAAISSVTALMRNPEIWLLYNGCISYILIGLLMGGEYLFRGYYKAKRKAFIPSHQLLALRHKIFWQKYWGAKAFVSYPHYIGALAAKIKNADAKRVFVISEDRAYFLAGFLAALYANVPVVLPQSDSIEHLKNLMEPGDSLLTDQPRLESLTHSISMRMEYTATSNLKFAPLDPKHAFVIFYTSGSTSKPKAIKKTLMQLEAEVEVLHNRWGQGAQGNFLSTVSHYHLYAFLYSLLWPVCAGFPLERQTFTYWGDLLKKSLPGDFLISSPSHLGRFTVLGDCRPISLKHTFSSGAPLSYTAAAESKKFLGSLPIEVYGSTETGGIAFRQQEEPNTPWQRFDCVELSSGPDNKLRVKSPYIDGHNFYQTEDCITWINNDSFHLLGRADRVVKLEGKRASLNEIESNICKNELVAEAAVVVLEKSYRDELGAVLVLSKLGLEVLKTKGKLALMRRLREALSLYFHAVVIPRKWRFVDAIPVNAQGKRLQSMLNAYFTRPDKKLLGPIRDPIILQKDAYENKAEYTLRIPQDLAYFEGHFKNTPILPGVVQLDWAVELAKADLKLKGDVTQSSHIKFANVIRANAEVSLILDYDPGKSSLVYTYKAGATIFSSGRMIFSTGRC